MCRPPKGTAARASVFPGVVHARLDYLIVYFIWVQPMGAETLPVFFCLEGVLTSLRRYSYSLQASMF